MWSAAFSGVEHRAARCRVDGALSVVERTNRCFERSFPRALQATFASSPKASARAAVSREEAQGFAASKKEEYKFFDEATITVRAGRGGDGEAVSHGAGKQVRNNKYNPGGNSPKRIWLPASAPADGGDGGDVVLQCDPAMDSLLQFHSKSNYVAKKGPQGNPEEGSQGSKSLSPAKRPRRSAPPCVIPVPPGTVVKRKGTGRFLGELLRPGEELRVAKGGRGGYGVVISSKRQRAKKKTRKSDPRVVTVGVEDVWRDEMRGLSGEEMTLQLLLRVVADVGFVGLPNAGKSALLAALSRARPEIAPYPFTTLIPNLGVMGTGGDPVLVDLPGLIEGAHVGRGLGRNFLRHLRRTRMLLHVVDASLQDPADDYRTIREELRMYNPQYCERPHVVALNKIDLLTSTEQQDAISDAVRTKALELREAFPEATLPEKVIWTSAVTSEGVEGLQKTLQEMLGDISQHEMSAYSSASPWEDVEVPGDNQWTWES